MRWLIWWDDGTVSLWPVAEWSAAAVMDLDHAKSVELLA